MRVPSKRAHAGPIWFDDDVVAAHRRMKQPVPKYIWTGSLLNLLTTPLIYSVCLPFVILDLWVTLYQWTCFPIYGIARVPRQPYFAFDRRRLAYLNIIEKMGCTYCSYANGLIAYVREVTARTERYWCPIKHAQPVPDPHTHYEHFVGYGDGEAYHRELPAQRRALSTAGATGREDDR